jgi:hypothetical protein
MYTKWTSHLSTEEEQNRFKETVLASKPVLNRIKDLMEIEEKTLDRTELDPKAYDNTNWPYKQAFKNGYRAGLAVAKKLVDIDNQKILLPGD